VARLAPLTSVELVASVAAIHADRGDPTFPGRAKSQAALRELHQVLMRAAASTSGPPLRALEAARALVAELGVESVDAMLPRPRTVFRLLGSGALDAAWEVLKDNATGVVDEPFHASTATGSARTSWRLPLLTLIEPPTVYADLPGFRDPRYGAPDDCYDITETVRVKHRLDEVFTNGATLTFGGWAALDALVTGPQEVVRLVASSGGAEIIAVGRRLRRPDLSRGDDPPGRRAWAGWSATLDLGDPRLVPGTWDLSLELDHHGISRRAPIGAALSELAGAATRARITLGPRTFRWDSGRRQLRLVVGG
jgi:hypothetical protein